MHEELLRYIRNGFDASLRRCREDANGRYGLPHPYTVPCTDGSFQELFYWDTFFSNRGLLRLKRADQAANNLMNLCHLAERFGKVPNASAPVMCNRSQPPLLAMMAADIRSYSNRFDDDVPALIYDSLELEYRFWTTRRTLSDGLARYGHEASGEELRVFSQLVAERLVFLGAGFAPGSDQVHQRMAEAESGWDFTPRFGGRAADYAAVDLNSNLYRYEWLMAAWSRRLRPADTAVWRNRARKRLRLMNRFLWNDAAGVFLDVDESGSPAGPVTAASYWPLWMGLATSAQARYSVARLRCLETPCGLAAAEPQDRISGYQWDYPFMWPPLVFAAVEGLRKYGCSRDAGRIARKFLRSVEQSFWDTGRLWEKYDARSGEPARSGEYETPEMIGWTAGVYLDLANRFRRK